MELLVAIGVLAVLVVALLVVPVPRQWRFLLAPFIVPAWLAALGAIEQATTSSADCYEECGYTWTYLFAVVTLIAAVIVAVLVGVALAVVRRRPDHRGRGKAALR